MDSVTAKQLTVCACVSRSFIDKDMAAGLAALLKEKGFQVRVEADLCRKAMEQSPDMKDIASGTILACFPRAVKSMFDWLGLDAREVIDMRNNDAETVLQELGIGSGQAASPSGKATFEEQIAAFTVETGSDAWYPVIDKSRCTDCGKCNDFCLFGVYSVEGKTVRVASPAHCKNNCPACARMCPSTAIVFPKYEKSPINGGTAEEEVFDPDKMEALYNERLKYRLQQRRMGVSLLKNDKK